MECEHNELIIDIYCQIDRVDEGEVLELNTEEVRCPICRKKFQGTFIIQNLEETGDSEDELN